MKLVKDAKNTEIEGIAKIQQIQDLINLMINYYQSTFLKLENWLTKQERKFFIACVIIANKGLQYTSAEARGIFKEIFNLRRQSDIRGHLLRLEEKNWLKSDTKSKEIELVDFFKFDLSEQRFKMNITLLYG